MLRIGWVSPLSPKSGVGTFSHHVTQAFPRSCADEPIDLTILYLPADDRYTGRHREVRADVWERFGTALTLFDIVIYNIGNNKEHHDLVFGLLQRAPGIVILHDHTYQHYLAGHCINELKSRASYGGLMISCGGVSVMDRLDTSRITSRLQNPIYGPWDSEFSVEVPCSVLFARLGSAAVVHSRFSERVISDQISGPILRLNMPFDQKESLSRDDIERWRLKFLSSEQLLLVAFGHIGPTKCLETVIKAIASSTYIQERFRFIIAGFAHSAPYLQSLRDLVKYYRLELVVSFEISLSDKRLADLKRLCDIFINLRFPNTEGSSVSLVEQLATAKPVIIYNAGCYAEVPDQAAVKLSNINDHEELATQLHDAANSRSKMIEVGRNGFNFATCSSCSSYAKQLTEFIFANSEFLIARGKAVREQKISGEDKVAAFELPSEFLSNLASSRLTLDFLEREIICLDPRIFCEASNAQLARYVALVVLGQPESEPVAQVLSTDFVFLETSDKYWKTVHLYLLTVAAFDGNLDALTRLKNMSPNFDAHVWKVVLAMPAFISFKMAALLLTGSIAEIDSLEIEVPAHAKRVVAQAVLEIIAEVLPEAKQGNRLSDINGVIGILKEACEDEASIPIIKPSFIEIKAAEWIHKESFHNADLQGVWTSSLLATIRLRLDVTVSAVIVTTSVIGADANRPRKVTLSMRGHIEHRLEFTSDDEQTAILRIPIGQGSNPRTFYLDIASDRLVSPASVNGSPDTRSLGVYVTKLQATQESLQLSCG